MQKFEKKYTKYKNLVLNSGFYNQTIKTNSTFDHKGVYDLKKKIISNEKQFEILKNKKKSIFERIFKHPYKIYENPSNNKYFVDETLRAYNIVKDFRKNSSKQRWKSFRNFLKSDLNLGKLSLEKKLNRTY